MRTRWTTAAIATAQVLLLFLTSAPLSASFTVFVLESTLKMPYSTFVGHGQQGDKHSSNKQHAERYIGVRKQQQES